MQHLIQQHRLPVLHLLRKCPTIRQLKPPSFRQVQNRIDFSSAQGKSEQSRLLALRLLYGTTIVMGIGVFISNFRSSSKTRPQPEHFSRFTLIAKDVASPTSCIFTLKPTDSDFSIDSSKIYSDAWMKGVWSIQLKQPQLQIARSYTPLPSARIDEASSNLRFFIRRESQGEVSNYLHRLQLGDTVEIRGPHLEFEVPEDVNEILFIAGGTGIAPALQVAHYLFESHRSRHLAPKLHILWANRGKEDSRGGISDTKQNPSMKSRLWNNLIWTVGLSTDNQGSSGVSRSPLVRELDDLKERSNGNITVDYFVDETGSYITDDVLKEHFARPSISEIPQAPSAGNWKRLILLSGPEGFITHFAGPKVWLGGRELQGTLGGSLKKICPRGWEIWKL